MLDTSPTPDDASERLTGFEERRMIQRENDSLAGGLIIESAGGEFSHQAIPGKPAYRVIATNGLLRRSLRVPR